MGLVHHPNVVTDGLIACWDAGNRRSYPGAGTTWTDVVGGNEGTLENMDTGGFDSQKGGVIEFDGTDEYVDTGSNQILPDGRNPFTISIWVRPESGGNDWSLLYTFKQDNNPDGTDERDFLVAWLTRASYYSSFYCGQRGTTAWGPAENIGADREDWYDKWCCVTVTYNGEGSKSGHTYYRLYINDVNYTLGDLNTQGGMSNVNRLGINSDTSWSGNEFKGAMANLSVWNRALSADEVSQNYEATKTRFAPRITTDGLFASWDAGDPASYNGGQTWTDTANGFVGPFYNGAGEAISFDPANGGSLVFDGTDDRIGPIMLPGDYSGTARSIILWVSPDTHEQEMIAFNSADDKFKATVGQSASYGTYIFRADVGGNSPQVGSFADSLITVEDWACIGMTINASDEIVSMYLNGVSKTGGAQGWNFQADTYIGRSSTGAPWNGKIATVRLYTKTLSAGEVLDNYRKTKARFGH